MKKASWTPSPATTALPYISANEPSPFSIKSASLRTAFPVSFVVLEPFPATIAPPAAWITKALWHFRSAGLSWDLFARDNIHHVKTDKVESHSSRRDSHDLSFRQEKMHHPAQYHVVERIHPYQRSANVNTFLEPFFPWSNSHKGARIKRSCSGRT